MKGKPLIIGVIILAAVILFVISREDDQMPPAGEPVLVYYAPVQCLGNPWEQDWIKENGNDPVKYPKDQEVEIIKSYYETQGVAVIEVTNEVTNSIVCQSCSCPRGDTLSLLVARSDAETMRDLGFELTKPEKK